MSAPGYSTVPSDPVKGIDPYPPTYDAVNPPNPVNPPVQPQAFPTPLQTAIMPYMAEIPGIPSGLEYLTQIDQVLINEKFSTGQRWNRSYEVLNNMNQRMFLSTEQAECCSPLYKMHITDNNNKEVIQLLQPCRCSFSPDLEIYCPPDNNIGYCVWNWSAFVTSLSIQNAARQCVLVIVGPGFQTNIFGDVNFEVKSNDESQTVGVIRRESGHFSVHFPLDLDVNIKAVLIGSSFYLVLTSRMFTGSWPEPSFYPYAWSEGLAWECEDHLIYRRRQQMMHDARQHH